MLTTLPENPVRCNAGFRTLRPGPPLDATAIPEKGGALHTIRCGRMPLRDARELVESLCDDVMAMLRARPKLRGIRSRA